MGAKGIFIYQSPMCMISGHTCKWMYNNNSILLLKMDAMSLVGGIWYMHKLIIASSTTLHISAKLHKLLPVHPTGHMLSLLCVHIFDVGKTNASIVISN